MRSTGAPAFSRGPSGKKLLFVDRFGKQKRASGEGGKACIAFFLRLSTALLYRRIVHAPPATAAEPTMAAKHWQTWLDPAPSRNRSAFRRNRQIESTIKARV
jgi:hypothetical protein